MTFENLLSFNRRFSKSFGLPKTPTLYEVDTMEKIDRQFLENVFGTEPELEDLNSARDLIDEWIVELKDDKNA